MITVSFTPDEFANTQTALEEYLGQLYLGDEPEEDQDEVIASVESALARLDMAGLKHFES